MADLFIPSKIKVGFQKRADTFTGKLAYVIYYDEKGKLRKETSWEGWRDSKIDAVDFDNKPHNNFVLNKGVQRDGHWGSGRSIIRIYDPRDFEFEISVDNLIGLLMHSDVSKRDIVQECVYAWAGKELVLLPTNSEEYQKSLNFTSKQSKNISTKDLVKGHVYSQKKSDVKYTYIGYFQCYEWHGWGAMRQKDKGKKHIFYDGRDFVYPGINTFAEEVLSEPVDNYAELVDKFFKNTKQSRKLVNFKVLPASKKLKSEFYKMLGANKFVCISHYYSDSSKLNLMSLQVKEHDVLDSIDGQKEFNIACAQTINTYNSYYFHQKYDCNVLDSYRKEIKGYFDANGIDHTAFVSKDFDAAMRALNYGKGVLVNEDGDEIDYK